MVYGQLILEEAKLINLDDDIVEQIFDAIIRDFSKFALQLSAKSSATLVQQKICERMIKHPYVDNDRYQRVLDNYVYETKDQYEMNP